MKERRRQTRARARRPTTGRLPVALTPLCALLASIAIAGCGGETRRAESEATTAHLPTRPAQPRAGVRLPVARVTDPRRRAYIVHTDRICERFDPERGEARRRAGEAADIAAAVRSYGEETALGAAELKRIEAIPAPPGERALLQANVFGPIRRQLALRARMRAALAAVDVPRLRALRAQSDGIGRALSAFARGYGWRACGEAGR